MSFAVDYLGSVTSRSDYARRKKAEKLEKKDKADSENVLSDMSDELRTGIKENLQEKYQDHMIFLKVKDDYYVMIDVSATLYRLNEEDYSLTEIFSMRQYACGLKIKGEKLYFFTGKRESREKRNLQARLIHPYQIVVLTDVQKWAYHFETGQIQLQ